MSQRDDSECGFTLIELLIALTIMSVVFGTAAVSFSVGLRTSREADARVLQSADADVSTVVITRDLQAADTVATTAAPHCGGTSGGEIMTLFHTADTVPQRVTYRASGTSPDIQLTRQPCAPNAGPVEVVARYLTAVPAVTCTPTPCTRPLRVRLPIATNGTGTLLLNVTPRRQM